MRDFDRQTEYDWLRGISCFSVVILHIASMYLKDDFADVVSSTEYMTASFWHVITRLAVPTFVMLSGAFNLKYENVNYSLFLRKTYKKIVIPTLIFSALYVLLQYAEIFMSVILDVQISREKQEIWKPILDWIMGKPHVVLWYMYMIIPLYLVTPILVMIKSMLSANTYRRLAAIMMIYGILVSKSCSLSWILEFVMWIGYFMMGDVIKEWGGGRRANEKHCYRAIASAMIITSYLLLTVYWYMFTYKSGEVVVPDSFSWIVIMATMIQFVGFSMIRLPQMSYFMKLIIRYSLYIYLLHPMFCEVCLQLCGRILKWFPDAKWIPFYSLVVMGMCIGIVAFLLNRVANLKDMLGKR